MARVILLIAVVALTIYCTVEVAQAPAGKVRVMPKWLWAVFVIMAPILGPFCWLFFGRPRYGQPPSNRGPRYGAPDDDPDFLRSL